MNILVAVASRHGSTHEIAEVLAQELRTSGHAVAVRNARDVGDAEMYDAVVIGSAAYMGNWLPEARLVEQGVGHLHRRRLDHR